jgi:trans-aconitate methyltransferase
MSNPPAQDSGIPRLYQEFAEWWHVLSPPADYEEEAAFFWEIFAHHSDQAPQTLLELGCGGGNNASFLKAHAQMTLVDLALPMLEMSRALNPECEHQAGDMRTIRLNRYFDGVFIHDAIDYMTSLEDLTQAITTAAVHCRPGGILLLAPDYVQETFTEAVCHGSHTEGERGMAYLEWTYDPDPSDGLYVADYAYLLRDGMTQVSVEHDRHLCGLFERESWLQVLDQAGFATQIVVDMYDRELFVGIRR